jgi:nucleoredoxin
VCLSVCWSTIQSTDGQTTNAAPASDNPMSGLDLSGIDGAPATNTDTTPSPFVEKFKGHLLVMDNGTPKEFDASTLKGVQYWAFYYSASWCGPCRAFTPKLVDFYKYFKKSHPNFELIFVGNDGTQADMLKYMQGDNMPWPTMKYPDLDQPAVSVKKYFGPGIPDLVLTDAKGTVLSDTFNPDKTKYLGPNKVLDDIKRMVPMPAGSSDEN